jgi:Tfp pilus assembly protein FimT
MRKPASAGFTLTELMVILATITLLSAAGISESGNSWRRERVNAVAIDLAGWLDTVRRASMKGNACLVTFTGGSLAAGATLATASQIVSAETIASNCLVSQPLTISTSLGNSTNFSIAPGGSTSFKFTPRGTVNAAATNTQLSNPIVITISLEGSAGPLRCVRISEGLGLISIGSSDSNTGTCPDSSYGQTI